MERPKTSGEKSDGKKLPGEKRREVWEPPHIVSLAAKGAGKSGSVNEGTDDAIVGPS